MRTYPRVGEKRKQDGGGKRCQICDRPAAYRVDVQLNEFRGDDDVIRTCGEKDAEILAWYNAKLAAKGGAQ